MPDTDADTVVLDLYRVTFTCCAPPPEKFHAVYEYATRLGSVTIDPKTGGQFELATAVTDPAGTYCVAVHFVSSNCASFEIR